MKLPKVLNKAAIALNLKEPPRRRGLGKKNPVRIAQENGQRSLSVVPQVVTKTRILPNGRLLQSVRTYKEVAAVGGINSDWAVNAISEDSDIWQNIFLLRQRSRDLFRTDVYFKKYREELWSNVFGSTGYSIRLLIKETDDRVVYSDPEKSYLKWHERRRKRVNDWIRSKNSNVRFYERQTAQVQVGDFDLYAIKLIEEAWQEWQRREYCTVTGRLNYNEVRQQRLLSAARDGDFFIQHIRDPRINKFGYSQRLINSEWCDFYLNTVCGNGNEIRMGIERDKWGKAVNYYFIRRQPMDWQYAVPGAFNYAAAEAHEKIPAEQIIHYARYEDADSARPAPWSAACIPKSRHLDKYEESEVVAARVAAMKLGFFYSDVVPEGGTIIGEQPDPTKANTLEAEPGSFQGLEYGIKFQGWDPNHPNGNFDLFRKGMLRAWCAGLPGANYNIIANDLEGVNYSSGRLGMLDERELWKLIQEFDISVAEIPTFENWLEMSLMTGAIPLPFAKYDKFNKPCIRGRRWAWVDPLKEVQAGALQVANKFISRTRIIEDSDVDADFEQVLLELAEEQMMMEELGMDTTPVVGKVSPAKPAQDVAGGQVEDEDNEADGSSRALSMEDFERQLAIARGGMKSNDIVPVKTSDGSMMIKLLEALVNRQVQPGVTVNVPPISVPQPIVNISELKVPEQKAPVVNFSPVVKVPEIKMPEPKEPNVIVNVAPPDVHVHNEVKIPSTKGIKVKRGSDGKMEGLEIEKE